MTDEKSTESKSLGIVDWFGGYSYKLGKEMHHGFIKVLLNRQNVILKNGDVRLKRKNILPNSRTPSKNSFVKFRIVSASNGKYDADEAFVVDEQDLMNEINFDDADEFETFLKNFESFNGDFLLRFRSYKIWANQIFNSPKMFKVETILKLWNYASDEDKFAAFEKYCTKFSEDEFFKCGESLLRNKTQDEIVEFIKVRRPDDWQKIISRYILNDRSKKGAWATWLLDNLEIFRILEADEGFVILVMYAAAKEEKISKELIDILETKVNPDKTLCAQIVYSVFHAGNADDAFTNLFNAIVRDIEREDLFPLPSNYGVNIFPPCHKPKQAAKKVAGDKIIECFFCEAVSWHKKDPATGECYEEDVFCPRLGGSGKYCKTPDLFPNKPDLNLPSENWSLLELVEKLGLKLSKFLDNEEYIARLGGEFNRIYELRERLKCRSCGKYMRSVKYKEYNGSIKKYADWKEIQSVADLLKDIKRHSGHFAIFNATVFECENHNVPVYLNYCWHCKEIVDSRDCPVSISATENLKGYYSCINCGAGYFDAKDTYGEPKYAIEPGTLCPKCPKCTACGGQDFLIVKDDNKKTLLKCRKCGNKMYAPQTMTKLTDKKFKCSSCGHIVRVDSKKLEDTKKHFDIKPMPWAVENENLENESLIEEPKFWSSEEYVYHESLKNSANKDFTQNLQKSNDDVEDNIPF